MATETQNKNLELWLNRSLCFDRESVIAMNVLYDYYCQDMNPSLPVRPKAFSTAVKRYAQSKGIKDKVGFFYLRGSQVQGWVYNP